MSRSKEGTIVPAGRPRRGGDGRGMSALGKSNRARILWLIVVCVALGTINTIMLFGRAQIDPTNLAWLQGDRGQYQAAWEFLRFARTWSFPLTWVSDLGYPLGISTSYFDVIPIVALPFRLFANQLPIEFQYLGLYALLSNILQMSFGYLLVSRFTKDTVLAVLGGLLFLIAPPFVFRLQHHLALSSHWIILAALYFYFRKSGEVGFWKYIRPQILLTAIAGAITPYIAVMVVTISAAAVMRALIERQANLLTALVGGICLVVTLLTSWLVFGFLTGGENAHYAGGGFTLYSMNLLSPILPSEYPSLLFPAFQFLDGQHEGYNYLGLGVIAAVAILLVARPVLAVGLKGPVIVPIALASVTLALFALSTKLAVGQYVVFNLPLPDRVFELFSAFRSSGRFFWILHYLLVLFAVAGMAAAVGNRMLARLALAAIVLIQFVDTLPLRKAVLASHAQSIASPLVSAQWDEMAKRHRHLVVAPAWQCGPDRSPGGPEAWYRFAFLAARNGMTVNSFYSARISPQAIALYCKTMPANLLENGAPDTMALVLDDELLARFVARADNRHECRKVDGFNLCTSSTPSRAQAIGETRMAASFR